MQNHANCNLALYCPEGQTRLPADIAVINLACLPPRLVEYIHGFHISVADDLTRELVTDH
jgi:hypothetical protein